jgi:CRP/FNR family cyclic AMP-dependent transcriptional regulator
MSAVTIEMLRQVAILSTLDDATLESLLPLARRHLYSQGRVIVCAGDPGNSLFFVMTGSVKVVLIAEDGREVILSVLRPGTCFGEVALLDGEGHSACVFAMQDVTLLSVGAENFRAWLAHSPDARLALLGEIAHRLRRAESTITGLVLLDVEGRLANLLLDLADQEQGDSITRKLPHHTIAQLIGSSREAVSRTLGTMRARNVIATNRGVITLKDRPALALAGRV